MALFIKKNGSLQQVAIGHEISKDEQVKVVALNMAQGDQEVLPSENKVLSQVTITKPDTLVAGNIKNGVDIGGVVGTYQVVDYLGNRINGDSDPYSYSNSVLTSIASNAFHSDKNLVSISLPNVETVGGYAFYNCNCQSVSLPKVKKLTSDNGSSLFSGCLYLSSVDLSSLENINGGTQAFYQCSSLKSINLPLLKNIENATYVFRNSGLTSISLPSLETIKSGSDGQFSGCVDLETAVLHSFTGSTRANLFNGCSSLRTVDLGNCSTIYTNCFINCTSLTDITLSKSDTNCSLSNVNAFTNVTGPVTIHVPSNLISSYQSASNWVTLYNDSKVTFVAIQ